jgi:redox-sensitive bicupin YhaK (pirin superfamily)
MDRTVERVVPAQRSLEGGGFPVRRPFPTQLLDRVDPFLLLDEMGPVEWPPGQAVGAPDHPHRGFETVTYLLAGGMEHRDSAGNSGRLNPGDVQWMTAGSGVVHAEMPQAGYRERGGLMHGFQLWVNLPRADKMAAPRYQDTPSSRIPEALADEGRVKVRVIAGESLGHRAVIETHTPILYLHVSLAPGADLVQEVPADFNLFAYVFAGSGLFGSDKTPANDGELVVLQGEGAARIAAPADAAGVLQLLLVGGAPLREPVARYGPFVMNTKDELTQAFDDYRHGKMGRIRADARVRATAGGGCSYGTNG